MSKKITTKPKVKGTPEPIDKKEAEEKVEIEVEEIKEAEEEVKVVEEKPKPKKKTRKRTKTIEIEPNELVSVRSVTKGLLIYKSSRTGQVVKWNDFGSKEYMEFGELVTMKSSNPKFINEPLLVVDDEEVVEKLGLKGLYENMIDVDNIERFFDNSPDKIKEKLNQMPAGNRKLVGDTAHEMVKSGKLYDIRKIKLLERELGIGLQITMD